MRTPMLARRKATRVSVLLVSALLLAACTGESTSPKAGPAPLDATKALLGVVDGVYTYTVNPNKDAVITLGASRLELPAQSICALAATPYGPRYWNVDCESEALPVTITAVVSNANTNNPSVEFSPALRFKPDRNVRLYLRVSNVETLTNMATMLYCGPFSPVCVDESLTDASLVTTVDHAGGLVSRRVKHFSGYVVAERYYR